MLADMQELLEFAVRIARAAGSETLRHFLSPDLSVEMKGDGSPVTRADRAAEELLRGEIARSLPQDGILGEEFGEQEGTSGRRWILDPVDGTKAFARGIPLYGTLVGLEQDGRAVLGVAYLPALGEMVYAAKGLGARWITGVEGNEIVRDARVSQEDDPARALLCTTSIGGFRRIRRPELFDRLRDGLGHDRGYGDCYGHILVATGRAEVMVDPVLAIWDCAALVPIVEEAGGTFTDLAGNATHRGKSGVSTNGHLHEAVRRLIEI
jgi:histidinol phosphatase-like enzyme (inositol monophosphatase family)